MSNTNLDFKMRLKAETADFSKALKKVNDELKQVRSNASLVPKPTANNTQAAEAKRAAKEREAAEKAMAKSIADEEKRIEKLRNQAEKAAAAEAKRAAKERMQAEREHNRTAQMLARELERERVKSERAAAQAAKEKALAEKQAAQERAAGKNSQAGLYQDIGIRSKGEIEAEIKKVQLSLQALKASGTATGAELQRAAAAAKARVKELNAELKDAPKTNLSPLSMSIGGIGAAAVGAVASVAALGKGISDVLAATQEFQAIQTRFTYAFNGAEEGAKQLQFVREEANRLGLEFTGAANGYAQLASATKELNISQEQTQGIFKGVASTVAGMGLSADEANGVFLALSQIAGKGKVSMEELRGQLGERLTPAMSIAAKAMGVTTAELEKMVENGISAEKFLPKFGAALEDAFSDTAAKNAESLTGQINLLKNRYNEFLTSLGNGGVGDAAIAIFKDISSAMDTVQTKLNEFMQSQDGQQLQAALKQAYELIKQIGTTAIGVFDTLQSTATDVFSSFGDGEQKITLLQGALNGVALAMAAIGDGVSGVQIAFNVFAGAVKDLMSAVAMHLSKLSFGDLSRDLENYADRMHNKAQESYDKAQQQAMQFDSSLKKVLVNIAETGNSAGVAYDQTAAATQKATAATEEYAQALAQEQQKAKELDKAFKDAQSAAQDLGVDMKAATNEVGAATTGALENVQKLADNFDVLKQKSVDAGRLIREALSGSLKNAINEKDIAAIVAKYQELGQADKLSMKDVESGVLSAKMRLQELRKETDPTAQAFKKLGVQTKEAMKLSAEESKQAFERVKQSGQATADEVKKAFEKTAEAMLRSGDAAQQAWVKAQASAYNYKVKVDETGKAALESAQQVKQAAQTQTQAFNKASEAADETAQSTENIGTAAQSSGQQISEFGQKIIETYRNIHPLGYSFADAQMGAALMANGAWSQFVDYMWNMHDEVNRAISQLNQSTESGIGTAQALAKAEVLAANNADKLDKTTLDNLKNAIAQARQEMQALAEDAANTLQTAEKELLKLQGKTEQVEDMERKQKIAELSKKQKDAERKGNTKAAQDYQATINVTEQTYRLKAQQKAEAKAKEEAERVEAERQAQQEEAERQQREQAQAKTVKQPVSISLPEPPSVDLGNLDLSGLTSQLNSRDKDVVNQAAQQVINKLQQQLKART
ncbi:tape measure protein [Kingella negevensis]|uniref:Tape measure protein N-terminal domain-containing protein n=1 Tax=Kingella negevensis TaxID=1522312 RepID=A0A238HHR3_9NEIS|nr:tape measure protein [Kingella negevensis]MDK4696460.1 tape measure protein [Kingella negevensis]SNB82081.1 Uncharacterised protein [Kingella negevensis]